MSGMMESLDERWSSMAFLLMVICLPSGWAMVMVLLDCLTMLPMMLSPDASSKRWDL